MLKALDGFIFALARVHMGATVITIEMKRADAERLCFEVGQAIEATLQASGYPIPEIWLGTVFSYRGVKIRIVETA